MEILRDVLAAVGALRVITSLGLLLGLVGEHPSIVALRETDPPAAEPEASAIDLYLADLCSRKGLHLER